MSEKDILELEGLSHLEQLDKLLESRLKRSIDPIKEGQNDLKKLFGGIVLLAAGVVGFLYLEMNSKADAKEVKIQIDRIDKSYLGKVEYYRIEKDEHERMKEAFLQPSQASYIILGINEHIINELGLQVGVSRGSTAK